MIWPDVPHPRPKPRSGSVSRPLFLHCLEPAPHFWAQGEGRLSAPSPGQLLRPPLRFAVPPSISKDDSMGEVGVKEVKTKVNSTLTLECECWAAPPPAISWYKDGRVSWAPWGSLSFSPLGPPGPAPNLPVETGKAPGPRAGLGPASLFTC